MAVKLIDFWAPWCGPCRLMDPVLEEITKELGDKFELLKVNADEKPEETNKYGIMGLPTYVVEKDGKEIGRRVGITPKADLIKLLQS